MTDTEKFFKEIKEDLCIGSSIMVIEKRKYQCSAMRCFATMKNNLKPVILMIKVKN
ncbi:MAG: hypothetical protein ACTHKK_01945 [Candidatus Nitrosocosmicus sp.]